jgi:surfeit locus 1 family protein
MENQCLRRQAALIGERRVWPVLLASGLGILILCGLGTWQVERLAQKQALIATLQQRLAAEPVSLAEALTQPNVEYLKVKATGTLDVTHVLYKQTIFHGLGGWEAIAPFKTESGTEVLIDLGGAPSVDQGAKPLTEVTGILRLHNKGRGYFDNDNNPAQNQWFWWDLSTMQKAAGLSPDAPRVIVQALTNESGFEAAEPKVELANNHLGYAITWFGLAMALAGVTLAFVLKKPDA